MAGHILFRGSRGLWVEGGLGRGSRFVGRGCRGGYADNQCIDCTVFNVLQSHLNDHYGRKVT